MLYAGDAPEIFAPCLSSVDVRGGEMSLLTSFQTSEHDHRVPHAVLREQGDGLPFLQAILLHQCRADIAGIFFDFTPIDTLTCDGIEEAAQIPLLESLQRRVMAVEEPIPY